jgi:hypothetical protein
MAEQPVNIYELLGLKDGGGFCRNNFHVEEPVVEFINLFYPQMKGWINRGYNLKKAGFDLRSCEEGYVPFSKVEAYLVLLLSMYFMMQTMTIRIRVIPGNPTIIDPYSKVKLPYTITKTFQLSEEDQKELLDKYHIKCVVDCLVCEGISRAKILQALTNFGFDVNLLNQ